MLEPYFTYINAPGQGGKVVEHNKWFIKSESQKCSAWAGPVKNPYRDLQFGGIVLGFNRYNYWFSLDSFLGKIFSSLV